MQTMAILAPIFSVIALMFIILTFIKLGRINSIAFIISAASLIVSFAYFLRGVLGVGQYLSDLIFNWFAFLLWLAISAIFLIVGLPHKPPKEK